MQVPTEDGRTARVMGTEGRRKHKKHQSSLSQQMMGSMSQVSLNCNTVIVRDAPLDALSSVLYRKSNPRQPLKKQAMTLKHDPYQKARLQQQMRGYELREQLDEVRREAENTSLKQKILEGLLFRCDCDPDSSFYFA